MPRIIPIRDLRNTSEISEICNSSQEPVFVTKNGYGDMVIMSMAIYERTMHKYDMQAKILEGKAQADKGELLDGALQMNKLREKYGV